MALKITGEHSFPGTMLVAAMLRAHAATKGNLWEKRAAGVGIFNRYLEANSARSVAWKNAAALLPDVAVARASLNREELEAAGRALEAATDVDLRRVLLGQIIAPFFSSQVPLLSSPVAESGSNPATIEAGALAEMLQPQLPGQELVVVDNPGHGVISPNQVTNAQYGIFINQTGHRVPYYWNDPVLGMQQPDKSVVGVDYNYDAMGFAKWLGRSVPTEPAFLSAKKAAILTQNKLQEWIATNEDGGQIILSLHDGQGLDNDPYIRDGHVAFRVAGT